jgi:hypothetical protein
MHTTTDLVIDNIVATGRPLLDFRSIDIPSAGYIDVGSGRVYEYVGRTLDADNLTLHNVSLPRWVTNTDGADVIAAGSVGFLVNVRDGVIMDVIRNAIFMEQFRYQLMAQCTADSDRSFYSQMLAFYAGERDKGLKSMRLSHESYTPRVMWRNEFAQERAYC